MFGEVLKRLREQGGMSQEVLGKKLNVSRSTISMYEAGEREPNNETLITISNIFGVSMDFLFEKEIQKPTLIPVYGTVAAGIPIEAITNIEDYEEITEEMAKTGAFAALKIKGDSMEPRFTEGDIVIIKLQEDVNTGDIAIVMIANEEATCKKIKKTPEGVMLISTNPKYEPMFYSNKEIMEKPVKIWGKVVELRAKF